MSAYNILLVGNDEKKPLHESEAPITGSSYAQMYNGVFFITNEPSKIYFVNTNRDMMCWLDHTDAKIIFQDIYFNPDRAELFLTDNNCALYTINMKHLSLIKITGKRAETFFKKFKSCTSKKKICYHNKKQILYMTCPDSNRIFSINKSIMKVAAGDGSSEFKISSDVKDMGFGSPDGICVKDNTLFLSDTENSLIRTFNITISGLVNGATYGSSQNKKLIRPSSLSADDKYIYVVDGKDIKSINLRTRLIATEFTSTSKIYDIDFIGDKQWIITNG